MPSAEVTSYTAHVGKLGLLGSERLLVLQHERGDADGAAEVANSEIYFSDRFGSGGGFSTTDHGPAVTAHLPVTDYSAWLDLLRHEAPIFIHWSSDTLAEPDASGSVHISTGPEPPGEGSQDQSPAHGT